MTHSKPGLISLAVFLAATGFIVSASSGVGDDSTEAVGAVLVLVDGTRLEASRIERSAGQVVVELAGGGTVVYAIDDVDLEASRGIPGPADQETDGKPSRSKRPTSLSEAARDITLVYKDEDPTRGSPQTTNKGGTLTIGSLTSRSSSSSNVTDDTVELSADDEEKRRLVNGSVAKLQQAWSAYRRSLGEIRSDCQGYTMGTSSAVPGRWVVSRRATAACQDAVRRALARLPALEAQHQALLTAARKAGLNPGQVRQLMSDSGLSDFRAQVRAQRSNLQALQVQ